MTIGDITKTMTELQELGYPVDENCELIADMDLKTRRESLKIFFTDGEYRITVIKEI